MKTKKPTGRPVTNRYGVPAKQWAKWSNSAKRAFNEMYYRLRPGAQWIYMHPKAAIMAKELWETTRWNVAWEAANMVQGLLPITAIVEYNGKGEVVRTVKVKK